MKLTLLLFLLFCLCVVRSEVTCTLDPEISTPTCLHYYDNAVGASAGIAAAYYVGNETCGGSGITEIFIPYNVCTINAVGNQTNCTVYTDCLAASKSHAAYMACLPPASTNYKIYTAYNTTSYTLTTYYDANCTNITAVTTVPFGCANTGLMAIGGTDCLIYTDSFPSNDAGSLMDSYVLSFLF